nr:RNA-directed DNA polymerase, eukaryota [Tanacetum cinerariifolium]
MCLNIEADEYELRDLNEPADYKAALSDPKKWLFKKKTDIDGAVHTYKARLVAKGFTQTPGIDYEETFSPVADIRAIMIFIAIAAFYDYEIWQMDVKTAFLNGYLSKEDVKSYLRRCFAIKDLREAAYILGIKIYRDRSNWLISLSQSSYIEKILKIFYMENSKRGSIPMQEKLKLSKSQGASTPVEVKHMQNVSYSSVNIGELYWTVVKNILKYLHNTKDMFLIYGGDIKRELRVSCYTDAGYLTDADDLKSQTRYDYISSLINRWNGDCVIMGDFNEVRCLEDRMGIVFNVQGSIEFNNFISNSRLVEIQLEGYSFTWSHPSASKMSKLDRFFVTEGVISMFPHLSGVCLDKHLSDHRPILLQEVTSDYGPISFRVFHSWFNLQGFDQMVQEKWSAIVINDNNMMVRFKKKLQILKKDIRDWDSDYKKNQNARTLELKSKLRDIDRIFDQGGVSNDLLLSRVNTLKQLQEFQSSDSCDCI